MHSLDTIYSKHNQEYFRSFFTFYRVRLVVLELKNYVTKIFIQFTFKRRVWQSSKDSANGINVHCNINLDFKFFETKLQDFYSNLQNEKFPMLRSFGLRLISISSST
jgi:hypothetical protein